MGDDQGENRYEPPCWRLAAAFLLSPLPPVALFALYWRGDQEGSPGFVDGLFAGAIGAYPPVLFLGIPLLLILRRSVRPTVRNLMLSGAAVASAPWWILALVGGSTSTIEELALPSMLLGFFGGLVFYFVGVYRHGRAG